VTGTYLDSSALVKLVFEADESQPLRRFLRAVPLRFCSVIGGVEVLRVAHARNVRRLYVTSKTQR